MNQVPNGGYVLANIPETFTIGTDSFRKQGNDLQLQCTVNNQQVWRTIRIEYGLFSSTDATLPQLRRSDNGNNVEIMDLTRNPPRALTAVGIATIANALGNALPRLRQGQAYSGLGVRISFR